MATNESRAHHYQVWREGVGYVWLTPEECTPEEMDRADEFDKSTQAMGWSR